MIVQKHTGCSNISSGHEYERIEQFIRGLLVTTYGLYFVLYSRMSILEAFRSDLYLLGGSFMIERERKTVQRLLNDVVENTLEKYVVVVVIIIVIVSINLPSIQLMYTRHSKDMLFCVKKRSHIGDFGRKFMVMMNMDE